MENDLAANVLYKVNDKCMQRMKKNYREVEPHHVDC